MESSQDITNNRPLNDEQKHYYIARMKAAWAKLPDDKKNESKPMLDQAHQQYADFVKQQIPPEAQLPQHSADEELPDRRLGRTAAST